MINREDRGSYIDSLFDHLVAPEINGTTGNGGYSQSSSQLVFTVRQGNKTIHPTASNAAIWIRASLTALDELDFKKTNHHAAMRTIFALILLLTAPSCVTQQPKSMEEARARVDAAVRHGVIIKESREAFLSQFAAANLPENSAKPLDEKRIEARAAANATKLGKFAQFNKQYNSGKINKYQLVDLVMQEQQNRAVADQERKVRRAQAALAFASALSAASASMATSNTQNYSTPYEAYTPSPIYTPAPIYSPVFAPGPILTPTTVWNSGGTSSRISGNTIWNSDGSNTRKSGNTYWHSDGSYTRKSGNTYWNSDGSSTRKSGNTYWHSDGSSSRVSGNTIWHSNGTSSRVSGSTIYNN